MSWFYSVKQCLDPALLTPLTEVESSQWATEPDKATANLLGYQSPTTPHLSRYLESDAKDREVSILHQLNYPEQQSQFFDFLEDHTGWNRAIVAYHLNLPANACQVAGSGDWLHGSCKNVCIPVAVAGLNPEVQPGNRVLVRFPLPYRVGEFSKPGNSDEKVRCEAGTYAWLEENCPNTRLYGFGMGSGETFTRIENLPLMSRWIEFFHRALLILLDRPIQSRYVRRQSRPRCGVPKIPYLLIEYIEESQGRMLSSTWTSHYRNTELRANFFRDLSRIYLSLSNVPLPKIGSFTSMNSSGDDVVRASMAHRALQPN